MLVARSYPWIHLFLSALLVCINLNSILVKQLFVRDDHIRTDFASQFPTLD